MRVYVLAAISVMIACSSDRDDASLPPSSPPQAVLSGTRPHAMRNCPSAVPSAITTATPVAGGVDVTITSKDPLAQIGIRARAAMQASLHEWTMFPRHSGFHGGPGNIGYCPIIHANTMVSSEPIADGARIHVQARSERDVEPLQTATEARVRALTAPTS